MRPDGTEPRDTQEVRRAEDGKEKEFHRRLVQELGPRREE